MSLWPHFFKLLIAGALVAAYASASMAATRLPGDVASELKKAGIPTSAVAVLVQDVDARRPSLSVNADAPMNPASVMKLVTTYAALELLGPAYTWRTAAYAGAPARDGVLDGDLYLRGGGDPHFGFEQFWLLLRQLRARGVREVRGDLVLDRGAFDVHAAESQPLDDQTWRAYHVAPDALLLNFRALRIALIPEPGQTAIRLGVEPDLDQLELVNNIRLGDEAQCGEWKDRLRADFEPGAAARSRLVLSGVFAAACGEREWSVGAVPADQYLATSFRSLWRELGGTLRGTVRAGAVPDSAQLLAMSDSPPLGQMVREVNKFSNNVMARQIYLTIGLEAGHRPARPADAESALRAWLTGKGMAFPELVLENGAGLSRRERISAASLGRVLRAAWNSPLMPEFIASLPLSGVDGTMKKRLTRTEAAGVAHIKTGTLDGVKTLAGYVRDRAGRYRVVVFLVNHPAAEAAQAAQDALLLWAYRHPGRGTRYFPPRP